MVFGRKKKETTPAEGENDLALAAGAPDDASSTGDSVPPPPPEAFAGGKQNTESIAVADDDDGDGESIEADQYVVTMPQASGLADEAKEGKDDPDFYKKLGVILLCISTFFVLLGVSIKYGVSRNQRAENSIGDPLLVESGPAEEGTSEPPRTVDQQSVPWEDTPSDPTGTNTTGVGVDAETAPGAGEKTVVPSQVGTTGGTLPAPNPFAGCTADGIVLEATCVDGASLVSMDFCLANGGGATDEFWAWVETPDAYARFVETDWGWLRDEASREVEGLPGGTYVIGLFSDGRQLLPEYPLLVSQEFTVSCAELEVRN